MKCHTGPVFTKELTIKLNNFGMEHQALCQELLAAKQLGICKTTISSRVKPVFKSLDSILANGKGCIKIDIILTNVESRETSS